jgi:hypothetical protein
MKTDLGMLVNVGNKFKTKIMKKAVLIYLMVFCSACQGQSKENINHQQPIASSSGYAWTKVLDSADWSKSYNFQMFELRDTLWTFHHDGSWYSADGHKWTKSPLRNAINNLAFLDYVKFKNAIYGLGFFDGNIERYTFKGEIYKTTDFKNWVTVSKVSNLPNRFFYHPYVFDDKIWFIGGENKDGQFSDIWNSEDGVTWKKQKSNLPFGKRSRSEVLFFKGKLYLLDNDVWSSKDGLNWSLQTKEIIKGETIFGYAAVVYDGKIWLLGCNRNGQFKSQVFVSSDGKKWEGQEAPWTPRGGVAAVVFKDKIYLTGGKYGGLEENGTTTEFVYSNDLWALEKKE